MIGKRCDNGHDFALFGMLQRKQTCNSVCYAFLACAVLSMYEFNLVLLLLQQMCVFLVIAWLMSKTRLLSR